MDLYVTPLTGLKSVEFIANASDDKPRAVVTFEGQGGLIFRVVMDASEWRWLGIELHKKKTLEDQRMDIE